jgi:hypothetical protein
MAVGMAAGRFQRRFRCVRVVVQTEDAAPAGVERLGCLHHGQRQVHAVEHGTARAGIGGEFGVRQEVQGHVELQDRTRAGLLLGVERILDTADEEARLVDPSAQDALAAGPSSSPMDFSTFSTDARTCCSRSLKPGRLSPLTWSTWVKMTCSLLALPETAMPSRAATGAACIGWAASSTSNTAATRPPLPRGMRPTWRPDDGPVSRGKD